MFIGEKLRSLRVEAEKTQEEVAKYCGITPGSLAHYECDRRKPNKEMVLKFCGYFNVEEGYFYGEPKKIDKVRELINDLINDGIIKNAEDINGDIASLILDAVKTEIRMNSLKNKSQG